jgi:hypothetical protein
MVHMTNRPYVHVRLRTLEFLLGHDGLPRCDALTSGADGKVTQEAFFMMASATLFGTSMYFANSIVNVARPWLMLRTDVA